MTEEQKYIRDLEKIIIFLCDTYTAGQDSLTCQTTENGQVDDKWANIYMMFPTIQGFSNRNYVRKIGNLRTKHLNRESIGITFEELYKKLKQGRTEKVEKYE